MGTEATIDAPRAGQAFVDRPDRMPEGGAAPQEEPLDRKALDDLLAAVRQRPNEKQVGAFVAQPSGLVGVGVVGQDAEGFLVMEVPVPVDQIPEEVSRAVDTIRYYLDEQLNAERDRMRRLLV